jgi:hypothetical protein
MIDFLLYTHYTLIFDLPGAKCFYLHHQNYFL